VRRVLGSVGEWGLKGFGRQRVSKPISRLSEEGGRQGRYGVRGATGCETHHGQSTCAQPRIHLRSAPGQVNVSSQTVVCRTVTLGSGMS
jgi:hypothetical protein